MHCPIGPPPPTGLMSYQEWIPQNSTQSLKHRGLTQTCKNSAVKSAIASQLARALRLTVASNRPLGSLKGVRQTVGTCHSCYQILLMGRYWAMCQSLGRVGPEDELGRSFNGSATISVPPGCPSARAVSTPTRSGPKGYEKLMSCATWMGAKTCSNVCNAQ